MCTDVQYESTAVRRFVRKFPALINLQDNQSIVEFGAHYYCDRVTLIKQKHKWGKKTLSILFLYNNIIIFIIIIIK